MARKRMISPEFWTDEKVGGIPVEARLLFMGLISNADDEGRLPGNTQLIKSLVFPYDTFSASKVEEWLSLIAKVKIIIKYRTNDQDYIQIKNFLKHQTINRPSKSKIPPYLDSEVLTELSVSIHGELSDDSLLKEEKLKEINISSESQETILANYLLKRIRENNPSFRQPNIQKWVVAMDKLLRIDNRPPEEVKDIIDFSQEDEFWKTNILSPVNLRKQYDRLIIQRKQLLEKTKKGEKSSENTVPLGSEVPEWS